MKQFIIAIDGPSGVGKGTIAKRVAKHYNIIHLDSGCYYRSLAYLIKSNKLDIKDHDKIINLLNKMDLIFKDDEVILNGENITGLLRNNEIDLITAHISCIKDVRLIINTKIRNYIGSNDVVIDGRDATTIIYPNSNIKIYLDADIKTRAERRYMQNKCEKNIGVVLDNIEKRDKIDRQREFGALVVADDAIIIDTTNKSIDETVDKIIKIVEGVRK